MKPLVVIVAVAISLPAAALAERTFKSLHPEEQYSDKAAPLTPGGPYEELLTQVQEKLRAAGFDAGPANGAFSTKTQAALAQYQRANLLPVSGAMDGLTLATLGVELPSATATSGGVEVLPATQTSAAAETPGSSTR